MARWQLLLLRGRAGRFLPDPSMTTRRLSVDVPQDMGASPLATGLSPTVEPASSLAGSAASIPSAAAWRLMFDDGGERFCVRFDQRSDYWPNAIELRANDSDSAWIHIDLEHARWVAERILQAHRMMTDAQGTSGSAQDRNGLDPKGAGPVAKPCAQPSAPNISNPEDQSNVSS